MLHKTLSRACFALILLSGPALAAEPGVGAFIDSGDYPWSSIGQVNVAGYRRRQECTGTLIAPRLALTAAHCLFDEATGAKFAPHLVHFLPGVRRGVASAHAGAACLLTPPGYVRAAKTSLSSDIAVIVLTEPLAAQPVPLAERGEGEAIKTLTHAGYPATRRHLLSVHRDCALRSRTGRLMITDCQSGHGGSGGPMMLEARGIYKIAGVLSSLTSSGQTIAVRVDALAELGDWTRCP